MQSAKGAWQRPISIEREKTGECRYIGTAFALPDKE